MGELLPVPGVAEDQLQVGEVVPQHRTVDLKVLPMYQRKTEFRKLSDKLRNHLGLIIKQQNLTAKTINLNNAGCWLLNLVFPYQSLTGLSRLAAAGLRSWSGWRCCWPCPSLSMLDKSLATIHPTETKSRASSEVEDHRSLSSEQGWFLYCFWTMFYWLFF